MTIAKVIAGRGEVWSVHADAQVSDAVDMLARHRIGALPVEDGSAAVAGIFSERDMMTAPVITVAPQTSVMEALALMTQRRFRHLPVVEGGRMVGFVSIGDLVKHRLDKIEAEADAMRVYIQQA